MKYGVVSLGLTCLLLLSSCKAVDKSPEITLKSDLLKLAKTIDVNGDRKLSAEEIKNYVNYLNNHSIHGSNVENLALKHELDLLVENKKYVTYNSFVENFTYNNKCVEISEDGILTSNQTMSQLKDKCDKRLR